jgi:hypothetical protein
MCPLASSGNWQLAGLPPKCAFHQGDTNIMQKSYAHRHPEPDRAINQEIDRGIHTQLALARYRRLRGLKKSQLSLDDNIFIENFETAMLVWWNVKI